MMARPRRKSRVETQPSTTMYLGGFRGDDGVKTGESGREDSLAQKGDDYGTASEYYCACSFDSAFIATQWSDGDRYLQDRDWRTG